VVLDNQSLKLTAEAAAKIKSGHKRRSLA